MEYNPVSWVVMLLGLWFIWPGSFFLVACIGESRVPPIKKRQSRAFLPGDLSLAVMFMALLSLHENLCEDPNFWGYAPEWWMSVTVLMLFVALKVRSGDVKNYPHRSGVSPSKIWHDVMGYWFIPSCLIVMGVPPLVEIFNGGDFSHLRWAIFCLALAFYATCVTIDVMKGWTPEDVTARHPEDWKPLWK